ncbi:hypothetical protein NDU88_005142 [Pleurodeles waltl]|uniref:Uncharacterized protein n=1 Tax=Pleurodeles waltl TaxID=8319 RepID=A0AAV7WTW7_PLEWA|nr:hypothetical protein NDU88_005142 [Pleurodeles waltl]
MESLLHCHLADRQAPLIRTQCSSTTPGAAGPAPSHSSTAPLSTVASPQPAGTARPASPCGTDPEVPVTQFLQRVQWVLHFEPAGPLQCPEGRGTESGPTTQHTNTPHLSKALLCRYAGQNRQSPAAPGQTQQAKARHHRRPGQPPNAAEMAPPLTGTAHSLQLPLHHHLWARSSPTVPYHRRPPHRHFRGPNQYPGEATALAPFCATHGPRRARLLCRGPVTLQGLASSRVTVSRHQAGPPRLSAAPPTSGAQPPAG